MSRNRGHNTKPEVTLRKLCFSIGLRYVLNSKLAGRPDFVFPRSRVAVFVDGCFWHGCPQHYQPPATRAEFWRQKIERNRARDAAVNADLDAAGWRVLRIWEHTVRREVAVAVEQILVAVRGLPIERDRTTTAQRRAGSQK
jgi:DNA mismatch endonuclease, patch repair protein